MASTAPEIAHASGNNAGKEHQDISQLERTISAEPLEKPQVDYNRVDAEVAKYASTAGIVISKEESTRLRKLIDRRVLVIMICTYFLQAIDKGTMSFASIMGIREDRGLQDGQKVRPRDIRSICRS